MNLYRPVGLHELELIYDSGMKTFPARLPQQPIFYPVLQLEYARRIASDWNVKNGQFAGYVTQFKVEEEYISQFEVHTAGGSQREEFWISAEEMEEFNRHISGHIKVLEAYFGEAFQGFVPEKFGLQGKNAVEQFTQLANTYIYKRMDFYLEIKRNHKAVFLNYPFWQKYDFKNQGLKEKVIQAIREAWLTSFPKIPLPVPVPTGEAAPPAKRAGAQALENSVREEAAPVRQTTPQVAAKPIDEDAMPVEQTETDPFEDPDQEDDTPLKQTTIQPLLAPVQEQDTPAEQTETDPFEEFAHENSTPEEQSGSHFAQGVKLGLDGKYREAIAALSRAVEEERGNAAARTSLAVAFHRVGEEDRALSCYESALQLDPKEAEAHYFRANILYSRGNVREAIAGYTAAIGLRPELIEAHQKPIPRDRLTDYRPSPAGMRWIARSAGQILALNKSLESNPRQADLFKERAAEYSRLGNYEQAISDYSSSLAIRPDDADALHLRGQAYEQLGQSERALEDYRQAAAANSQLANVYLNRGVAFGKMGNFRQSIDNLTEGIRLAPGNPDGYFNRGTTYFQTGDFERAIDDFSHVIRLSPEDEAAYYWRGISKEEAGRPREAIADYRQFLAMSQDAHARQEIEQKLRHWNVETPNSARAAPGKGKKTGQIRAGKPDQVPDLYNLIAALGQRALNSTWSGSGVDCYGEKAEELYAFTDQNKPIPGRDLLEITSGIRQTVQGDFQAFDAEAASPWIFIRAWGGNGFYIETNDPKSRQRLKTRFQSVEEVEGAVAPYEGLFIRI